jgi:hypothetical protein
MCKKIIAEGWAWDTFREYDETNPIFVHRNDRIFVFCLQQICFRHCLWVPKTLRSDFRGLTICRSLPRLIHPYLPKTRRPRLEYRRGGSQLPWFANRNNHRCRSKPDPKTDPTIEKKRGRGSWRPEYGWRDGEAFYFPLAYSASHRQVM